MITQQYIQSILDYDKHTGIFLWKISKSFRIKAGQIAGRKNLNGYVQIGINKKRYSAHRLAWLYEYGEVPKIIDHINNIRDDNRLINLRLCNKNQNSHNSLLFKNNQSGIKGLDIKNNKWRTQIAVNKKIYHLGYFKDFFEACCSIYSARNKLHGEFANYGNDQ